MGENFRVSFLRRKQGALGVANWGPWHYVENTTADAAIETARVELGPDWESCGVLCELKQEGGVYASDR